MDNTAYSFGVALGQNVAQQLQGSGVNLGDLEVKDFLGGIEDAISGELKIQPDEINTHIQKYLDEAKGKQSAAADENKEKGVKFLDDNKDRPEILVTDTGLQYEVLKEGAGEKPESSETSVTVHYHGTTIDGSVFDSSVERGQPATFALNQVISGWTEGLQLMARGSKFKFYIPSDLAYGDKGAGPSIGPGATLVFEVELLDFDNK